MSGDPAPSEPRRLPLGTLLLGLITVAILSTWFTHLIPSTNDGSRFSMALAIAWDDSFEIGRYYDSMLGQGAIDKAVFEGKTYSDKAPLGGMLASLAVRAITPIDESVPWLLFSSSLFVSMLSALLIVWCAAKLALSYGASPRFAVVLGVGSVLATNLFHWSTSLFSQPLSAALVLSGFTLAKLGTRGWHLGLAGLLSGLAVSSDYYLLLLLPGMVIWCLTRRGGATLWFVIGAAVAGVLPAWYHWTIFGDPFTPPYKYQATFADVHAQGLFGIDTPRPMAMLDILGGWGYGLILFNPIVIGSLLCLPWFGRKHRADLILFVVQLLILTAVCSGIRHPGYGLGASFGPRYLMPVVVMTVLPLAVLSNLPRALRFVVIGLTSLSLLLNLYITSQFFFPMPGEAMNYLLGDGFGFIADNGPACLTSQYAVLQGRHEPGPSIAWTVLILVALAIPWVLALRRRES